MHGDDEPRGDDYIVSFKSYLRPDRAHQIVRDALHGQRGCATAGAWRVLPRHNAAYRLPSDFALVRLQLTRAHRRRALRALRRHSSVRLISPERRYGPSEPMPSKGLQSHAEQEPSPRHAEAASLSEPAHSPDSCLECGADAAAAYGVGRSGRLGRGRPRPTSRLRPCSSGGGGAVAAAAAAAAAVAAAWATWATAVATRASSLARARRGVCSSQGTRVTKGGVRQRPRSQPSSTRRCVRPPPRLVS